MRDTFGRFYLSHSDKNVAVQFPNCEQIHVLIRTVKLKAESAVKYKDIRL